MQYKMFQTLVVSCDGHKQHVLSSGLCLVQPLRKSKAAFTMVTHMKCYQHKPYYGCAALRQTVLTSTRQRCQNCKLLFHHQQHSEGHQQFILTVFM